ncbi:hypothetical protein HKCCE2091_02080 [Rhodobacterales bacterium HKCCE2091]|nr:hypothetical protein [Rhodobacterales bacterium HKCCE2091]
MPRRFAFALLFAVLPFGAAAQEDLVREAEAALAQLGFDPGPVDGMVDESLYSAIRAWQQTNGREATGGLVYADLELLRAQVAQLIAGAAPAPAPATAPASPPPQAAAPTPAPTPTPAAAGGPARSLSEIGGTPWHRIEDCPYEAGFGVAEYWQGATEPSAREYLYTDLCFDAEGGVFHFAEVIDGLVLTQQATATRQYAALSRETAEGYRDEAYVGQEATEDMGALTRIGTMLVSANPARPSAHSSLRFQLAHGFTRPEGPAGAPQAGAYGGNFAVIGVAQGIDSYRDQVFAPISQSYPAEARFDGSTGTLTMVNVEDWGHDPSSGGTFDLVAADGVLTGSGEVHWRTGVLAGADGGDWASLTMRFPGGRGFLYGEDGAAFQVVLIGEGEATTQDGRTFPVRGIATGALSIDMPPN